MMCRALVLTALLPSLAAAQVVSGRVARRGIPVEGAIILLVSPDGREVARVATRDAGRFQLRAPAGRYSVRVIQIGWRPATPGAVVLREGVTTRANYDLVTPPLTLASIRVTDRTACAVRPDSNAAAYAVWEAARASLVATLLTRGEPVEATVHRSDKTLARDGRRIVADSTSIHQARSLVPVRSLDARTLNEQGYVTGESGREQTFWAPDADVLLSEEFMATHCLGAELPASPDSASLIGVRFAPAGRSREQVGIEGVLWVDRQSAELRAFQYRYTNVSPTVRRANAGGVVEFLRIPRGRWIVHRWTMQYPILAVRTTGAACCCQGCARSATAARS